MSMPIHEHMLRENKKCPKSKQSGRDLMQMINEKQPSSVCHYRVSPPPPSFCHPSGLYLIHFQIKGDLSCGFINKYSLQGNSNVLFNCSKLFYVH